MADSTGSAEPSRRSVLKKAATAAGGAGVLAVGGVGTVTAENSDPVVTDVDYEFPVYYSYCGFKGTIEPYECGEVFWSYSVDCDGDKLYLVDWYGGSEDGYTDPHYFTVDSCVV